MKYRNVTAARIGRKTQLSRALALAWVLGGGTATMAVANPISSGQRPMAATLYVANCNDSGGGSLRDTIASSASGDTVDMTAMSCDTINLNSRIWVTQSNLVLVGKVGTHNHVNYFPATFIHSSNDRGFLHTGAGTLTLESIDLSDGYVVDNWGACIFSAGNVTLNRSYVHNCTAEAVAATDAKGGAIYAVGEVTLSGSSFSPLGVSSRVYGNVASAAEGDAYGGGIWAGGWVRIGEASYVYDNLAESANGDANGGGIYGKSRVDLTTVSSGVNNNKAETHGADTQINGAGMYSESASKIQGKVTGNEANSPPPGTSRQIGQGVGVFAEDGVVVQWATISDNRGKSSKGGGIFTNGYLTMLQSTVADNYAQIGAVFAKGHASIKSSTISGNRSAYMANIVLGPAATADLLIESSTISNNIVTWISTNGAALFLQHDTTIKNSTITGNVERNVTDHKYGAGISLDSNVNVALLSTIVGKNALKKADGSLLFGSEIEQAEGATGATITGNHSLIGFSTLSLPAGTLIGSPALGPLADNGGLTRTHEPCRSSQVIDNGAANGLTTDQRGPGFSRVMGFKAEIGAIEAPDYSDIIFRNGFENGACGG